MSFFERNNVFLDGPRLDEIANEDTDQNKME